MRHLLPVLLLLLGPANLLANPIALSSAEYDWSHWSFTVGGGLVISHIDYLFGSPPYLNYATAITNGRTSQGGGGCNSPCNPTSADSAYSNSLGHATASASAINGLVHTSAEVGAVDTSDNSAQSLAGAFNVFFLYGTGSGTLTVTIPYQLTAVCSPSAFNEQSSAQSFVSLGSGPIVPGVTNGGFQSASLSCADGPSKNGNLTIVRSFVDPTFGPLVSFDAEAGAVAVANIPDSGSSSALFLIGLLGIGVMAGSIRRF